MIEGHNHTGCAGYVANEHIDWTDASDNLVTTGYVSAATLKINEPDALVLSGHQIDCTDRILLIPSGDDDNHFVFQTVSNVPQIAIFGGTEMGTETLLPIANDTYYLGGASNYWKGLYVLNDMIVAKAGERINRMDMHSADYATCIRIFPTDALTAQPTGAALQFYGCGYNSLKGNVYIDTGCMTGASINLRACKTGVNIATRVQIQDEGEVFMPDVYGHDLNGETYRDLVIKETTGQLGYDSACSATKKENVRDLDGSDRIFNLRPIRFDLIDGAKDLTGLIAEEVAEIFPEAVSFRREVHEEIIETDGHFDAKRTFTKTDIPETIVKSQLIVPMLKELQNLNERVNELKAQWKQRPN